MPHRIPVYISAILMMVSLACKMGLDLSTETPLPAGPVDFYVSPLGSDDNHCTSLQFACPSITAAAARSRPGDRILVAPGVYTRESQPTEGGGQEGLILIQDLTILGSSAADTIIDAGGLHSGIVIRDGANVNIQNITVRNAGGNSPYGVVVLDGSFLELENSVVQENANIGIWVKHANISIMGVTVTQNGAALPNNTATAAGILNEGGQVSITNSSIEGNYNGGIFNSEGAVLSVIHSAVANNSGGLPGITNLGEALISRSGIYANRSTFLTGPTSGIENRGSMQIDSSHISQNQGGGINNLESSLSLSYVTIAFNEKAGLYASGPQVRVSNSIIAGHTERDCVLDPEQGIILADANLDSDGTCGFPKTAPSTEILLEVMEGYGDFIPQFGLAVESPAINAAAGPCVPQDLRGIDRPQGSACDLGAFEVEEALIIPTLPAPTATPTPGG